MIRHHDQYRIIISTAFLQSLNILRRQCDGGFHILTIGALLHTNIIDILIVHKGGMCSIQVNEFKIISHLIRYDPLF